MKANEKGVCLTDTVKLLLATIVIIATFGATMTASAETGIESLLPHAEAGKSAWAIFGMIFGSVLAGAIAFFLGQMAKGFAMGWTVKKWNIISEQTTCLRLGTATGAYDSPVKKIGPFAVFCQDQDENGKVVIDRLPHSWLVSNRITVVSRGSLS